MSYRNDYSALDRPEILRFVFYPRRDFVAAPAGAVDHLVPVESGISVSCRFYIHGQDSPSIIFFHGNGEVVSDYNYIAPFYDQLGINFFVADYRGYGSSSGMPTFASTVADASIIFDSFKNLLDRGHYTGDIFAMGRSLGSIPAIELASSYHQHIKGLIIESGFASIARLLSYLGFPAEFLGLQDTGFPNLTKIRTVTLPMLIIHGERDSFIPVAEAEDLLDNVNTENKRLVIIPGADHNTIMSVDLQQYFTAIKEFIAAQLR